MPHTTVILRRDTMQAVMDAVAGSQDEFLYQLSAIVADCFSDQTGEELQPGVSSKVYSPIMTDCPVDLALIIVAWWSPERAGQFEAIRQLIWRRLVDYYPPEVEVEVHLNVSGAPAD